MRAAKRNFLAIALIGVGVLVSGKGIYMGGKSMMAQMLLENSWQQALKTGHAPPPWPWMDTRPLARISVPALGKSAIILDTDSGQALAFGPVHVKGSARPGAAGTSVIAAHKNTHFAFLKDMRKGERINIQTRDGHIYTYEVLSAEIIDSRLGGVSLASETEPGSELVLVTCYPFDQISFGGPLRYIIHAQLKDGGNIT